LKPDISCQEQERKQNSKQQTMSANDETKLNDDFEHVSMDDEMMDDDGDDESLFWSMTIKPREEKEIEPPAIPGHILHITNACFGSQVTKNSRTVLLCQAKEAKIPLCVLCQGTHENHSLDLLFNESVLLSIGGQKPSAITLSGYSQPNITDNSLNPEFEEEAEMMELMRQRGLARKRAGLPPDEDSEEDDGEEDEDEIPQLMSTDPDTDANAMFNVEAPEDDNAEPAPGNDDKEEEEEEDDEEPERRRPKANAQPPAKKRRLNQNKGKKPTANAAPKNASQKNPNQNATKRGKQTLTKKKSATATRTAIDSEEREEEASPEQPAIETAAEKPSMDAKKEKQKQKKKKKKKGKDKSLQTIKGGIRYRDMKVGKGTAAQTGQTLTMYYVGQLSDNSVFDKCITGDGFKFVLGKGEVIKGWDMALKGMTVGSKRRLIIPAKLAYGRQGSPPKIPANAELTFTIELKGAA
jgi:FK506-binding nuclear protein